MVENELSDVWPVPLDFLAPGLERLRRPREDRASVSGDFPRQGFHPDFVLSAFTETTDVKEPPATE